MVAMRGKARSELDCVNPGYPHRHVIRVLLVIECNGARAPQIRSSFCFETVTDGRQLQWIGREMAKTTKLRSWTKEDVRTLKTLAREKVKTSVIARKLKRSVGATYQQASKHGVTLGTSQRKKKA